MPVRSATIVVRPLISTPIRAMILDQADRFARKELYGLSRAHGRRGMVARGRVPQDRRAGPVRRHGSAGIWRRRAGSRRGRPGRCRPSAAGITRWRCPASRTTTSALNNIYRNGNEAQRRKYLPDLCAGRKDRRARPDRARRRLRRAGLDAHDRPPRGRPLRPQRRQDVHHQRPRRRCPASLRQDRPGQGRARHFRLHRREGLSRVSASRRSSRKWAIAAVRPANWCSRIAGFPPKTSSARKTAASRS